MSQLIPKIKPKIIPPSRIKVDLKPNLSRLGAIWKHRGHVQESKFHRQFDQVGQKLNWSGASPDGYVSQPNYQSLLKPLGVTDYYVSLKTGHTAQFHLGVIPELSDVGYYGSHLTKNAKGQSCGRHHLRFSDQVFQLRSPTFWQKYLGKGSNLLCYKVEAQPYVFFNMNDVIQTLTTQFTWRLLPTGRIKGDVPNQKGVITFEYRIDKKQFTLGACGGRNGHKFLSILKDAVIYINLREKYR